MDHLEDPLASGVRAHKDNLDTQIVNDDLLRSAAENDKDEHTMTLKESFRKHRKAVFFSMALSAALIMEGYDVVVIASFYGQPDFLKRFGVFDPGSNKYIIPAKWQSALGNGSSVGGIFGLLINGWASERFGLRNTYMAAMCGMAITIFGPVFSQSLGALVASEVCCGLCWGVFQTLTTQYASEVLPISLRGYLAAYINMCWGFGIFLSSGVVRATLEIHGDWSWRLPFVIQWVWPVPLILLAYFCPESPYWLVRQGRYDDAEKVVSRLSLSDEKEVKGSVAHMIYITELERSQQAGTSYLQCFKGIDARRTEVAMMVFAMQLLSGQNLIGQGVQFFQQAGIDDVTSFDINLALNSMFIIGTVASWFLLSKFGRRTIYLSGMICMCITLTIIGGMGWSNTQASKWVSGALLVALNFVYNASLGAVCYVLISEVGSTRLRAKTIVLSRCAYQVMNIICGVIVPLMLSPTAWNWAAKSGIFWAGSAFLCCVYIYFRLPETRGRSYGELEVLFQNKVPAWRFASTKVDEFGLTDHQVSPRADLSDSKDLKSHSDEHVEALH